MFSALIVVSFMGSTALCLDNDSLKETMLSAIEKKYAGKSFEAKFIQVSNLAALDISESASGHAAFSHPGKMRWLYDEPDRHEIITNGSRLWIFRPDENQVMEGNADEFFKSGGGGAFLSDISLVRENFTIELTSKSDDHVELKLTAKEQMPDISSIFIKVSRLNASIEKVVTVNAHEDTNTFEFYDIRFHDIDPARFEFQPPEGVSIIDMNE